MLILLTVSSGGGEAAALPLEVADGKRCACLPEKMPAWFFIAGRGAGRDREDGWIVRPRFLLPPPDRPASYTKRGEDTIRRFKSALPPASLTLWVYEKESNSLIFNEYSLSTVIAGLIKEETLELRGWKVEFRRAWPLATLTYWA
jgi:hypothetical protein